MNIGFDDIRLLGIVSAYVIETPEGDQPPTQEEYMSAVLTLWERGINAIVKQEIIALPADKSKPEPYGVIIARNWLATRSCAK